MARSRSISVVVTSVGLALVIACGYLFYDLTARPLAQAVASRDWTAAQCLVESKHHELVYTLDGATGRRVSFAESIADRRATWEALKLHVGERIPCWVDPDDPSELVLERQGFTNLWPFAALVFLGLSLHGIALELRPRTGPTFWWGTMDNLGHATMRVGALRTLVIMTGLVLVVLATGVALVLQPAPATAHILVPLLVAGAGWAYAVKRYLTQLSISLTGPLVVGREPRVSIHVRTPFGTSLAGATLVAAEAIANAGSSTANPRRRVLRELPIVPGAPIPADLPGTLAAGPNRIAWHLAVAGAASVDVPVTIAWAPSHRTLRSDDLPRATEQDGVTLQLDRSRGYAPDDDITGVITVERPVPPRHATLRLSWRSRGELARTYVHPVVERQVADLPRTGPHRAADLPYREAAPDETGPLAASDQRRLRIPVPDEPRTYRGQTFDLEWFLELVVDDTTVEVPVTIQ